MKKYRNPEHLKVMANYCIALIENSWDQFKEWSEGIGGFTDLSIIPISSTLLKKEERRRKEKAGKKDITFNFPIKRKKK